MDRNRDSRKSAVPAVNGLQRRLQRTSTLRYSPEGKLHEKVRLRDREKLKHKKDRDRQYIKRRRVDRSKEKYNENESMDWTNEDEDEEDGRSRVYETNQREIRRLRSSPEVLRAPVDEVIGAVVPRRTRSSLARTLHVEQSSGSGGDLGRRRLSPPMASISSLGADSAKKKMKSSVEMSTHILNSGPNSVPSSTIEDEIEVAEALFDLMHQSQSQKYDDREKAAAADDEMKRSGKAGSEKHENESVKVNAESKVVGSREERSKDGRVDRLKTLNGPQELMRSSNDSKLSSCFKAISCDNQEQMLTKAKHVSTVVENKENRRKSLDKDFMIVSSRSDADAVIETAANPKVTVVDVATDLEVTVQNAYKRSATTHKDGPVIIQLQKEKEGAVNRNQLVGNGMGKSTQDLSSIKNTQQQNMTELKNQSASSLLPLSAGIHVWPGVLPSYPGYAMPPPQAVLPVDGAPSSSTGTQLPSFKFSQPRKKCTTHQYIARNIHHHQQLMKEFLNCGPTGGDGGAQRLDGNKTGLGTTQGGQFSANITSSSNQDQNVVSAASTNSKSSHVLGLRKNPSDSFPHGPGFIFPFGYHQANGITPPADLPQLSRSASSESNATAANSPSFNNPIFTSKEAYLPYLAMLQNSGFSIPATANNIPMPSLKGRQQMPIYSSSPFNFSPIHQQQSSPKQALQIQQQPISRAAVTEKILHASATETSQSMQFSNPNSETSLVHQFPAQLMNFASIPPQMMMAMHGKKNKVKFVPPEQLAFSFGSSSNASPQALNFAPTEQSSAAAAFTNSSSVSIPSMQWLQQLQTKRSLQQIQMARDKALNSNYSSGSSYNRQLHENFPSTAAAVVTSESLTSSIVPRQMASQSRNLRTGSSPVGKGGSALPTKETTDASGSQNGPIQKTSPSCRRDVPSILSNGQLSEPKY